MVPPSGSGVFGPIPAASRAASLAMAAWPLAWVRYTGVSGAASFNRAFVGKPRTMRSGVEVHFS